jgi:alcohol dehydrogenase class IV
MSLYALYCRAFQTALRIVSPLLPWKEPEVIEGMGSVRDLPERIERERLSPILIVTDAGISSLGLMQPLLDGLAERKIEFAVYDKTVPNPTIANIEEAFALYRERACKAIVAFGGGSPMDCAKGVGARVARPGKSVASMKGLLKVGRRLPPLFAIPTTAGTGSEATLAAIVSNPETHEKYAINDHALIPRFAVLDPGLTLALPTKVTSTTGMDALTHAVEAYVGRGNTKATERDAIEATRLIFENLEAAYRRGSDVEARARLLKASFLAGKAFTRAYVGYVHAIAHTLGGFYGTPHGLANAVLLPHVLRFYGPSCEKRLASLARKAQVVEGGLTDREAAEAFIAKIEDLKRSMDIPDYADWIKEGDVPEMAARALAEANPLYPVPRVLDMPAMVELYAKVSGRKA